MRGLVVLAVVVVVGLAARAQADSRIASLTAGYEKEAAACKVHLDGVTKVHTGAERLQDASLAADVAALAKAQAGVQAYCDELAATLDLLHADPGASYESLEKQLDEHDNKIRKLRQSSKQALDEVAPVIQRLIPRINARVAAEPPGEKHAPGKFPSGRAVELPALSGTWRVSGTAATDVVEYTEDKIDATVTVRPFSAATCDQQRKSLAAKADRLEDVPVNDAAKPLKLAWNVSYTQKARVYQVACVAGKKDGGWLATIDAPIDAKLPLGTVMARMLAAQIAQP